MRVGVNVAVLAERLTGVGSYVHGLMHALPRVAPHVEWVFLGASPSQDGVSHLRNVTKVSATGLVGGRRVAWEQSILPGLVRQSGIDLLHCPDFSRPYWCSVPVVNTIHDLAFYEPQPFFSIARRAYKRSLARVAVKRSSALVCVSEFTKSEVVKRYRLDPHRVVVIHNGVETISSERYVSPAKPFILFLGTLEERKNVWMLVHAFARIRSRGLPYRLVLVGQPGYGFEKIEAAVRDCAYRDEIEILGYLENAHVQQLVKTAGLVVYPSLYEGFGLPVLEAMACGTPVVCSRAASMPEVAGDAAEFFDPSSVEDLARAMERVLNSPERQAELRQKGLERAAQFSWDECARRHIGVYQRVLEDFRSAR